MTFVQRAQADKPLGLWQLDDSTPFQDYSGYGRTATLAGTEIKHPSLVNGALYGVVVDRTNKASFDCPVFVAGKENDSFTLEAWVRPNYRTQGYAAQTYRENLLPSPSAENNVGLSANDSQWDMTYDTSIFLTGTRSRRSTYNGTKPGYGALSLYGLGHNWWADQANSGWIPVTPGKTYTLSAYLYAGQGGYRGQVGFGWIAADGTYLQSVPGPFVNLPVNTWTRVTHTATVPAGVAYAGNGATVETQSGGLATAGHWANIDAAMMVEGSVLPPYFDGSMPGYEWAGAANQSISRSVTIVNNINLITNPYPSSTYTNWQVTNIGGGNGTATYDASEKAFAATITVAPTNNQFTLRIGTAGGAVATTRVKVQPGKRYYQSIEIKSSVADVRNFAIDYYDSTGNLLGSSSYTTGFALPANTWVKFEMFGTAPANAYSASTNVVYTNAASVIRPVGSVLRARNAMFTEVVSDVAVPFFGGNTDGAAWSGTTDASPSYMLVSEGEQQILGHTGKFDGLTLKDGALSFVTKYASTGEARAEYYLGVLRNVHIVAVHTRSANFLYVDGELVADAAISEAQQADSYSSAPATLVAGEALASVSAALNSVAIYGTALSAATIREHFRAGRSTENEAIGVYQGQDIRVSKNYSDIMFEVNWSTDFDWNTGYLENTAVQDDALVSQFQSGVTLAGIWRDSVDLYNYDTASPIYGVIFDWEGENETVKASLDGNTWVTVTKNRNLSLIPNGFIPNGQELYVEISFPTGAVDECYVENLRITAFGSRNFNVDVSQQAPIVGGNVHILNEYNEMELRDDWGLYLESGAFTIDPAEPVGTVEIWAKPGVSSGTGYLLDTRVDTVTANSYIYTWNTPGKYDKSGTVYKNGVAMTNSFDWAPGEWAVFHIPLINPTTGVINIGQRYTATERGNYQIGKVVLYPTQLSATQIADVLKGYTGDSTISVTDTSAISVSESATPATVYARDWSIVASAQ